jgi:hypothetical protein
MLNVTILETVNEIVLDKKFMHLQTSNSTISQTYLFVLLDIAEVDLTTVAHSLKNKISAGLDVLLYLLKECVS